MGEAAASNKPVFLSTSNRIVIYCTIALEAQVYIEIFSRKISVIFII